MKSQKMLAALAVLLVAIGCGGGGSSSTNPIGTSNIRVFATDSVSTDYDHVWVTIFKVDLVGTGGNKTVFSSATGKIIDVKTLRDSTGRRFALLSEKALGSGVYSGIQVTVGSALKLVPTGGTSTVDASFSGSTGTTTLLGLNFPAATSVSNDRDFIVDFDLGNWNLSGGSVSATGGNFLALVTDSSLDDPGRHENEDYDGKVGNLAGTAPNQTFTLSGDESTVTVQLSSATAIVNASGAPSPVLQDGSRVTVNGAFSTTTNTLAATTVTILDQAPSPNSFRGQITAVDASKQTLTVSPQTCSDFVPATTTLTIQVSAQTKLFSTSGVSLSSADFFAAAAVNGFVMASGPLANGIVTADKVMLATQGGHHDGNPGGGGGDGGSHGDQALVGGKASAVDASKGTFSVTVSEWEGVTSSKSAVVSVTTTSSTVYRLNGKASDQAGVFAALATANNVFVRGQWDSTANALVANTVLVGSGDGTDGQGGGQGGGGNGGG